MTPITRANTALPWVYHRASRTLKPRVDEVAIAAEKEDTMKVQLSPAQKHWASVEYKTDLIVVHSTNPVPFHI